MLFKPAEKKTFGTKPAAPAAAAQLNALLKDLIVTITALRDVLLRENDALGHSNTAAFMEIQEEKVATARKYEALMVELMSREDIRNADPAIKKQLFSLEQGFTARTPGRQRPRPEPQHRQRRRRDGDCDAPPLHQSGRKNRRQYLRARRC